jgi:hypothetical protein
MVETIWEMGETNTSANELGEAERKLAIEFATVLLRSHLWKADKECAEFNGWRYTDRGDILEDESVQLAVRYLELRGLLRRHPKRPDLIQPLFETIDDDLFE